jgi:sugar (pentulose or hexulose) kinase
MVAAVRDLIHRLLPYAPHCGGIVMCTQMHGLVLTDEHGVALSNAITWQDQRTLEPHPAGRGSYYDVLSQQVSAEERLQLGNDLWASRPLSVLFWLREQPHIWTSVARRGGVIPASLPDFALSHLCHTTPVTDLTNAASYGALDLTTGTWHHTLIQRLGLDGLHWSRIQAPQDVVGVLDIDGRALPCYTPIGDHQCAVLGTLLGDDELSINVSTGSQVGVITRRLELSSEFQTRPYFDGKYLKAVIHIPAGRALNTLIRLLSELAVAQGLQVPDPWAYIDKATAQLGETDLRVNLSFFPSSCGDTGAIENAREENLSVGHVFMAAFQNMAQNFADCARRVSPGQYHRLVFSGGLVQKSEALRRAIVRQFNMSYRFAPSPEDTLMGLLVLALVCSRRADSMAEATQMVRRVLAAPEPGPKRPALTRDD